MKKIIYKIIAVLTLIGIIAALPACGKTPTEKPIDGIKPTELGDYTIVYPSEYKDWQMEEVSLLQAAIKHVTGKDVQAVPDTAAESEKEIILASSKRDTFAKASVEALPGRLDFVISVSDDNKKIVLGGKDYFGDLRAACIFANKYLGYDDINGDHTNTVPVLHQTVTEIYSEPELAIMAYNPGKYPFPSIKEVYDMANAGFNMVELDFEKLTEEDRHNYIRWCTRFNIRILIRSVYDTINKTFNTYDLDETANNPIIYGHLARFTERHTDAYAVYKENYKQYGWKLAVKFGELSWDALSDELKAYFTEDGCLTNADILVANSEAFSINEYDRENHKYALENIKYIADYAHNNGLEFWLSACQSDEPILNGALATYDNVFRYQSYLALAFGAKGVTYEHYRRGQIVNDDYTESDRYEIVQELNRELRIVSEALSGYEYLGLTTKNVDFMDQYMQISNLYEGEFAGIKSYTAPVGFELPTILAYYKAEDSEKYAFIAVDTSELAQKPGVVPGAKYELSGTKITQYKDGEVKELTPSSDGTYRISAPNGGGVVVTIE